jgi:hypothetical protein
MEAKRDQLPAYQMSQRIVQAIERNQVNTSRITFLLRQVMRYIQ